MKAKGNKQFVNICCICLLFRNLKLFHQQVFVVIFDAVIVEVDGGLRCGGRHLNHFRSRIELDASVL